MDDPLYPYLPWAGRKEDDIALVNAGAQTWCELQPGRIGLRSFRDSLSVSKQLGNKAGSPLRIVPSDVVADFLQVGYGLGGDLTTHQRLRLVLPIVGSALAFQQLPPAPACRDHC